MDKMFTVMGANGFIGSLKLPSFEVICNGEVGSQTKWSNYKAIDFVKDNGEIPPSTSDRTKITYFLGVVGTDETRTISH